MPKIPMYTLAWSPAVEAYELYETRDREGLGIVPDSPAWFAWLDRVPSFAFVGKSGHFTARKEARQRGDQYWSAYMATGEQLTKKDLGKTTDLSLAQLEHIAGLLHAQSETDIPPPISLAAASTDDEMDITQRRLLAQRDTSLHPLLATKLYSGVLKD
jgi:hypothetical protein